jgi:hypothetical protein
MSLKRLICVAGFLMMGFAANPASALSACYFSGTFTNNKTIFLDGLTNVNSAVDYQIGYSCVGEAIETRVTRVYHQFHQNPGGPYTGGHTLGAQHIFTYALDQGLVWSDTSSVGCTGACTISKERFPNVVFTRSVDNNDYLHCFKCGAGGGTAQIYHFFLQSKICLYPSPSDPSCT